MERNLEVCEKLLQMVKCKEQFLVSRDLFDLDVLLLLGLRRELRNFEMVGAGIEKQKLRSGNVVLRWSVIYSRSVTIASKIPPTLQGC